MTSPHPLPLNPAGPAQSEFLIHFCGRPAGRHNTPSVPAHIRSLTPEQRLDNILWEQRIIGFPPFGYGVVQPMVCFSESPLNHLDWLLHSQHWPPWGVILRRQSLYAKGGGPVWYARPEEYSSLTPAQRAWAVRYEATATQRSDWVHEREWRIPVPPADPVLRLARGDVFAVLVGNPTWQPTIRAWPAAAGTQPVPAVHPLQGSFQRWFWEPTEKRFLAWPS